ncbi:HK97-gp10 family putative phage morphogenesis protein [Shinella sp. M31]|uniref:HK97-gp10 family putative phage morphogenesis protein n=1 Tax=Shinella sp. M31 TaxID=3368615 RepID=UPI003BA10820
MALKATITGKDELFRRLTEVAPNVAKYATEAKRKAGDELAEAIRQRAPTGATLEYMESIEADEIANRPHQERVSKAAAKDPTAVGLFAEYIWRFLEFGTAPHNTAPGGGTVLGQATHREGGGMQHPGTRAQPHIFPTYRAMKPKIMKRIRAAVNKGVREAMSK